MYVLKILAVLFTSNYTLDITSTARYYMDSFNKSVYVEKKWTSPSIVYIPKMSTDDSSKKAATNLVMLKERQSWDDCVV